jgi:ribulose-5-phosphate 4-epimerase/fuculose-1-phosphate aldolase
MPEAALREALCHVGKSLFDRGYVHSTAGNISVRLPKAKGYVITPTDACLGFLKPDQLSVVSLEGTQLHGPKASKTIQLHRRIYETSPTAHCIVHTHSTYLVAATLTPAAFNDILFPPFTPYQVMKVGQVPRISYHRPGDPAVADQVTVLLESAQSCGQMLTAVMLDRLGPVVWSTSPWQAMAILEELEETARLWWLTHQQPSLLTANHLAELGKAFNIQHGTYWASGSKPAQTAAHLHLKDPSVSHLC